MVLPIGKYWGWIMEWNSWRDVTVTWLMVAILFGAVLLLPTHGPRLELSLATDVAPTAASADDDPPAADDDGSCSGRDYADETC